MKPSIGKCGRRECRHGNQIGLDLNPGVPFTDPVLWGKLFSFYESQFLIFETGLWIVIAAYECREKKQ